MQAPDALFPTDNDFDIPVLMLGRQADYIDLPVRGWGQVARRSSMKGTWHFYVDDSKFGALWKHPEGLLKTGAVTTVEANFSTDLQMPYAEALYRIHKKRWMARYWQENGIRLIVDLNVCQKYEQINLLGVPKGWQAYATKACDRTIEDLQRHADIAAEHSQGEFRLLVYGTGPLVKEMCQKNSWIFIEDAANYSRKSVDKPQE